MVFNDGLPEHTPVPLLQHPEHVVPVPVGLVGGRHDAVASGWKEEAGADLAKVDVVAGTGDLR